MKQRIGRKTYNNKWTKPLPQSIQVQRYKDVNKQLTISQRARQMLISQSFLAEQNRNNQQDENILIKNQFKKFLTQTIHNNRSMNESRIKDKKYYSINKYNKTLPFVKTKNHCKINTINIRQPPPNKLAPLSLTEFIIFDSRKERTLSTLFPSSCKQTKHALNTQFINKKKLKSEPATTAQDNNNRFFHKKKTKIIIDNDIVKFCL